MSEVKSIFGDLQNEEVKDDEDKLVKTLKDFIENSEKLQQYNQYFSSLYEF